MSFTRQEIVETFRNGNVKLATEMLQAEIATDDSLACEVLVKLYQRQTPAERISGETSEHNGCGFSKFDSKFLGSLAELVIAWSRGESKYPTPLSRNQMSALRFSKSGNLRLGRYAKQALAYL